MRVFVILLNALHSLGVRRLHRAQRAQTFPLAQTVIFARFLLSRGFFYAASTIDLSALWLVLLVHPAAAALLIR